MSADLSKDMQQFYEKVKRSLAKFPLLAASEAQNFFLDSFKSQAWFGEHTEVWKKRKLQERHGNRKKLGGTVGKVEGKGGMRNNGRDLLIKTGRLKRSIRIKKADWSSVIIASDVPYAGVHNEGFKGTQQVGEHSRIATRRVATKYNKNGTPSKTGRKRIKGASHQVKAFTRHQNIPRRRFMGNSPYLNQRIDRVFLRELMKIK